MKKKDNNNYVRKAALYCRISRDEGTDVESNSITNQKKMLLLKAKELGYTESEFFVDDGYTGTNFNRPDFLRMLEMIKSGLISAVIVKDLSRLGRNYVSVGQYTEDVFPKYGVRFIAITDLIDSDTGDNDIAPFKNIMNEMYAKDISKKVRSSYNIRGRLGEPLGQPPYGYIKSPNNKKEWIIDPEAADVVRQIFQMCIDGDGNETIARVLSERHILCPTAYWQSKGINRGGKKHISDRYHWKDCTIAKMLRQQEYCGDVVNFKTRSVDFKHKARLRNPEENWVVFKNVHDPIIGRDLFDQVQTIINNSNRTKTKYKNKKPVFADLLFCADCGKRLWYHTNTINHDIHFFSCSNYVKDYRGTCPKRHYIREDALEFVILNEIRSLANALKKDEQLFAEILHQKAVAEIERKQKALSAELSNATERINWINVLYEKAYEDNAAGKIDDEWFIHLTTKYSTEKTILSNRVTEIRKELDGLKEDVNGRTKFIDSVRRFLEVKKLTSKLVHELIERIEVYNAEGFGKHRTQRIVILYRFVGWLHIPYGNEIEYETDPAKEISICYSVSAPQQLSTKKEEQNLPALLS